MIDKESNRKQILYLLSSVKRDNMKKLIEAIKQSDFFDAPASTIYHLSCKGGLAEHSLNVYETLKKLNDAFDVGLEHDTVVIVGLLHDICKVNTYFWDESNKRYRKKKFAPKAHGKRSIDLLMKFIPLSLQEQDMIRWHMNHYTWDGNFKAEEDRLKNVCPEAYLAYFADHISTLFIEEEN